MYCGNCGAKNDDTSAFCQACGAPLTQAAPQPNGVGTAVALREHSAGKKKVIAVIAGVVVVLLAVWLLFGGRGYKDTVEDFFDACLDGDVQGIIELIPPDLIDNAMEQEGFSMGELASELGNELAGALSYGGALLQDLDLDVDIVGDTDITGDDLQYIQEDYETYDVKVSKAKNVQVVVSLDAGMLSGSDDMEIPVIKVGRSWYLDLSSLV
nr:zinc ribbon domain-containing protein [uncultured Agathobaculum sp.]